MRLDKFLQVSRLLRRRALAKEACQVGRVFVNGRQAKPSTEVKPGDIIAVDWGTRVVEVEVLAVTPVVGKREAAGLYRILREKKQDLPL